MTSDEIKSAFQAERKHWNDLALKYTIYCSRVNEDECGEADTERVIKCLMNHYRETEEQVIKRIENSNIDNPISMNDEVFWLDEVGD